MNRIVAVTGALVFLGLSSLGWAHDEPGISGGGIGVGVCRPFEVRRTSHELAAATNHFGRMVLSLSGYSHLSRDAEDLAIEAEHLHESAHDGASCEHLRRDFGYVQEALSHLRFELQRAHNIHHNLHVMRDFRDVELAYRAVDRSLSGFVPPLPPAITTINVVCQSGGHHLAYCPVPGNILNAVVAVQLSHARCELGRSFGYSANTLWVSRGCRANFRVTIARH